MLLKSIPKSKNHQRRIFLGNYYRQRSKSKLNSKTKFKKKGRAESEARYRPRRYSFFFFFFFFFAFPFSPYWSIRYLAVGFFLFFLCAAELRGTFPGHPHPPSLLLFSFWATQHEIQHKHPWEAHPAWDLNPADLAVVSGECRSSFHHPTVSPY
jgi:hypothetical protein